jgi:hypothetical protein
MTAKLCRYGHMSEALSGTLLLVATDMQVFVVRPAVGQAVDQPGEAVPQSVGRRTEQGLEGRS